MAKRLLLLSLAALLLSAAPVWSGQAGDAQGIVEKAFHYMRGEGSISTSVMDIHRPDWQRSMTIDSWTKGTKLSIFYITEPPKDQGNGTLKDGPEMWMYNPKVNRVIKLPPSMMSQAWMGSDFSNNDLSKTDSLINDYVHTLEGTETVDGKKVFLIKSMPKPMAPVVWGMQKLKIREDNIFLQQDFYDEDMTLVKSLAFLEIQMLGGKLYPKVMKMTKAGESGKWTTVTYTKVKWTDDIPRTIFTLENLRNPRR